MLKNELSKLLPLKLQGNELMYRLNKRRMDLSQNYLAENDDQDFNLAETLLADGNFYVVV